MKEGKLKRLHNVWFLCKIQEQAKLICGNGDENSGYSWLWVGAGVGWEPSWGIGNTLYLNVDVTILWIVHLLLVPLTMLYVSEKPQHLDCPVASAQCHLGLGLSPTTLRVYGT